MSAEFRGALIAAAVGLSAAALPAHAVTFSDTSFANANWTAEILTYPHSDPSATFAAGQVSTGGDPGAYRQTTHNYTGPSQSITVGHLGVGDIYDPAGGAITRLDYAFDLAFFDFPGTGGVPSNAVGYGALIKQGGQYFTAPSVVTVSSSWAHFAFSVTAADFTLAGGGVGGPDFSAAGAPIQVGYFTGNGTCCTPTSTTSGIDNLRIAVTSVPEPGAWALMILGFGGVGTALRRTRRTAAYAV